MSVNLSTQYLGLTLNNPIVASACPLTGRLDVLKRLEDAGVAAVVLPSLFEEQIEHESLEIHHLQEMGSFSFPEATNFFPQMNDYNTGPDGYLELVAKARKSLKIPVIASLNGASPGGWVHHASLIQDAGADALELNIFFVPTDPTVTGADVEKQYLDLVTAVREVVTIPIAVKIANAFSALPNFAKRLHDAGANGLVLFNRLFQPDFNLEEFSVARTTGPSQPLDVCVPLRWIAILHKQVNLSLAATSGIHGGLDAAKVLLAGADVAMMATALLQNGPQHVRTALDELTGWLNENDYASVEQLKGSMNRMNCADPAAFERANYVRTLVTYSRMF